MDCIYMTPLHCPFALSLFWWLEPLGNVSGWASMFKSLGPSSTTTGSFWTAGADNCSFLGTLLWPSHLLWHFLHRVSRGRRYLSGSSCARRSTCIKNEILFRTCTLPSIFSEGGGRGAWPIYATKKTLRFVCLFICMDLLVPVDWNILTRKHLD